jgi:hypothetical protein
MNACRLLKCKQHSNSEADGFIHVTAAFENTSFPS